MGKRKRNGPLKGAGVQPSEYEDKSSGILNIKNFDDVADSEDEYHLQRDKILLEDQPKSKRQRQEEEDEDFLEGSDDEVLANGAGSESDDLDDEDEQGPDLAEDDGEEEEDEDEDSETDWGGKKSAYYNADEITTEQEAADEAAEARRIQQKQLQGLKSADFGIDEDEWMGRGADDESDEDEDQGGRVVEKLPPLQITPDMTAEERASLLKKRYPEFEKLAADMARYHEVWAQLKKQVAALSDDQRQEESGLMTRYRSLSTYLGAMAMYFAILTSPATTAQSDDSALPMAPAELRDHGILESVNQFQELWGQVQDMSFVVLEDKDDINLENVADTNGHVELDEVEPPKPTKPAKKKTSKPALSSRKAAALARTEASLADLDKQLARPSTHTRQDNLPADMDADYGDEAPLTAEEAAEKARNRRSLRFYTSQLAQRQNKRTGAAARAAHGDDDLPVRERWRDRMERLNREAEARGRGGRGGADIGADDDDDGDDDGAATNVQRRTAREEDDEYAQLMGAASRKKSQKASREAAYRAAASSNSKVVKQPVVDSATGRREIGYAIASNKGLTSTGAKGRSKKAARNPRVKKRLKFEDKTKKLKSMKPVYGGGEGRGGYGGELTGIKKGNVRATQL